MRKIEIVDPNDWLAISARILDNSQRIPESGCWIWDGAINHQGYGSLYFNGKELPTHRLSYMAFNGSINEETNSVCHHCDVKSCVNPYHLYQGTIHQNNQDAVDRDRLAKGVKNKSAKLNDEMVSQIRNLLKITLTKPEIARIYGVTYECIKNIHSGKNWGWLKNGEEHE